MGSNYKKYAHKGVLVAIILVAFLTYLILSFFVWNVSVKLEGESEIMVEYGDSWKDPGAVANTNHFLLPLLNEILSIKENGRIDTKRLGKQKITYTASFDGKESSINRYVTVVDTTGPEITLVSDPNAYTLPGHDYEEEGYKAIDLVDGDITDSVKRVVQDDKVIYTAKDSHGNTTEVERVIVYDDRTAPVIDLHEAEEVDWPCNVDYEDYEVTATDDGDGDVTDKIKVSGEVDASVPGVYVLTYTVEDSYKNTATAERIVNVKHEMPDNGKYVYLTFDDGPGKYTEKLLDILDKYEVKATFFVTSGSSGYRDLIGEEYRRGHTVAVHTYTHNYNEIYASDEAFWKDFNRMNDLIEEQTGERTNLFRFPGGSSNMVSASCNKGIMSRLAIQAAEKGYVYFDWNVSSGDAGGTTSKKEVYNNIINGIKNRDISIVLCHDIKSYTVDAIEDVIKYCKKNGYTFLPLDAGSPTAHHAIGN